MKSERSKLGENAGGTDGFPIPQQPYSLQASPRRTLDRRHPSAPPGRRARPRPQGEGGEKAAAD